MYGESEGGSVRASERSRARGRVVIIIIKYKKRPRQVQGKKNRYSRKTDWG